MGVLLAGYGLLGSASVEQHGTTPEGFLREWASGLGEGSVDDMTAFYEDSKDTLAIQVGIRARRRECGRYDSIL